MTNDKVTLLYEEPLEPGGPLQRGIEAIASLPEVVRVVGMVDLHFKAKTENPSSIAVATARRMVPKLSSVAQNCGMALVKTGLRRESITDPMLDRYFEMLRREDDRAMRRPDVTREDMRRIVSAGALAVLGRAGFSERDLAAIEERGTVGDPAPLRRSETRRLVPERTLERGRHGFGVVPAGNHFFEMQWVSDVLDRSLCDRYGLVPGDVTFMIHSDGGLVSDDIGNLYGNRTTATGAVRASYFVRKLLFHLSDARGAANWKEKRTYYFAPEPYLTIDPSTAEGRRYVEAKRLSMNAGYAARLTAIGKARRVAVQTLRADPERFSILRDFAHNSIREEEIGGRALWVHRHNACRVRAGDLVFLPGYSWTSSYVCVGGSGATRSLNTMDHGAGKTIDRFVERGLCTRIDGGPVTRSYDNESPEPVIENHLSDEGIDAVVEILARRGILVPIARLTPFAGYRYRWKGRLARLRESVIRISS